MINKLRSFFASGKPVDDVAELQAEAAKIRESWVSVGSTPPVVGSVVPVQVPAGVSIQQAIQGLPPTGSLQAALQQSAAAAQQIYAQQHLHAQLAAQQRAYATQIGLSGHMGGGGAAVSGTGGGGGGSTGGAGSGSGVGVGGWLLQTSATTSFGGTSPFFSVPKFSPEWRADYEAELEAARYARDVEET